MKKNLAVLFAVLMLALAGCSGGGEKNPSGPNNPANEPTSTVQPTEEPKNDHVVDYVLSVPDGFESTEQDGLDACWFRADGSNINLVTAEKDATTNAGFQAINADMLRVTLVDQMKSVYNLDAVITDRYFTRTEVCGLPAYHYCYDMDLAGQVMTQLIVSVNADKVYTFTYTANDADILGAFEESAKSIQLIFE